MTCFGTKPVSVYHILLECPGTECYLGKMGMILLLVTKGILNDTDVTTAIGKLIVHVSVGKLI